MRWERRVAPAAIGAAVAAIVAAVVGALTHPYAEIAVDRGRHSDQAGLVVRYALLGAVAAFLGDLVVRDARRHGSLRAALAARGAALLGVVALAGVVLVTALSIFTGGYGRAEELRDERAGFVNGCMNNASTETCLCVWEAFSSAPATDTIEERMRVMERVRDTGRPTPELQRAADSCDVP
jgi:hypothetical protein